jgi:hypothetical protein
MPFLRAFVYNALSLLLLSAAAGAQQQEQPRIAVKLSAAAHEKQQADPNFVATLIQRPSVQGFTGSGASKVSVSALIGSEITAKITRVSARDAGFQAPNFDVWYQLQVPTLTQSFSAPDTQNGTGAGGPKLALPQDVVDLIHELHKLPEVETAHALYPGPPPAIDASDDPRSKNQGYLDPAPKGIDARYAWGFTGGDGAGANIVDVEQGWNFNHEDLVGHLLRSSHVF